jgi:hypothetical protein
MMKLLARSEKDSRPLRSVLPARLNRLDQL